MTLKVRSRSPKSYQLYILPQLYKTLSLARTHCWILEVSYKISKGQDQESIQSSTTPDPRYQWESDKLTVDTTNESQEVSPYPAGDHKAHINGRAQRHSKHKTEQKHKRSTKEVPPTKENPYFGQNLTFQSAGVTLKIRSGSPKSS